MYRLRQIILLAGDLLALYFGLYLALFFRYLDWPKQNLYNLLPPMTWLFFLAVILLFIVGLYDLGQAKNSFKFFKKIIISGLAWIPMGVMFFYVYPTEKLITPKTILLLTTFLSFGAVSLWRYLHNRFLSAVILKTNVVFIGFPEEAKEIIEWLQKNPQRGYEVVGIIDPDCQHNNLGIKMSSNLEDIKDEAGKRKYFQLIVISPKFHKDDKLLKELYNQIFHQVEIMDLAKFYEEIMGRIPPFTFSESWFLTNLHEQQKKIYDRFRTLIDYAFAMVLSVCFLITFPFIALAIKLDSRGPIFFKQTRVGRQGLLFQVYKFRTMQALTPDGSAETNGPQFADKKDFRVTTVGKFLRRSRIDEIPQFINILKGQMSVVGPRPERPEFVAQLTSVIPFYALRHMVKPGLTGWAQLQQGYYGTIDENLQKLEYDLYYIKNRNTILDVVIVLKTINVLLRMIGR